jgi:uncharacterized membrane protein YuzA (DUF378 family)
MKKIAWVLVIIGALNWGLVGLGGLLGGANWNLVNLVFGGVQSLEAVIYLLVGISAVVIIFQGCATCRTGNCSHKSQKTQGTMMS